MTIPHNFNLQHSQSVSAHEFTVHHVYSYTRATKTCCPGYGLIHFCSHGMVRTCTSSNRRSIDWLTDWLTIQLLGVASTQSILRQSESGVQPTRGRLLSIRESFLSWTCFCLFLYWIISSWVNRTLTPEITNRMNVGILGPCEGALNPNHKFSSYIKHGFTRFCIALHILGCTKYLYQRSPTYMPMGNLVL
jgi:hypothetical protein